MKPRRATWGAVVVAIVSALVYLFGGNGGGGGDTPGGRLPDAPPAPRSAARSPDAAPSAAAGRAAAPQSLAIRVSPRRRTHILDGDRSGGGHGPGRGTPGKSEFPGWLTDDDVIAGIERIANDPRSYDGGRVPTGPDRVEGYGTLTGPSGQRVRVKVVVEPRGEGVITGYPVDVRRNP